MNNGSLTDRKPPGPNFCFRGALEEVPPLTPPAQIQPQHPQNKTERIFISLRLEIVQEGGWFENLPTPATLSI